jgi:pimeloyl-ACP methyl ester carboxylesterase
MPFAECGRHRLHYEVQGHPNSPPLLLVMGMGMPASAWVTLPVRLAQRFRVITFDNRGTGGSTAPRGRLRIRDMADDAARVLDAAGVERADVFGISMGGMIAQELVLRHPQRVRRRVLGATFSSHRRSRKPKLSVAADLARAVLMGRRLRPMARLLISDQFFDRAPNDFASWLSRTSPARVRTVRKQMVAVVLHETDRRLASIRVPTLVVSGDRDRLVPVENSRRLAKLIPGARLVEFPGAGHAFPYEREEETVQLIVDHCLGAAG